MFLHPQFERQKLAREHKKKEDAATLEDIKEQIRRTEDKLDSLKKEKHELFTTLKRVRQAFFLHTLNAIYVSRISGKLSFCHFGTEFNKLKVFRQKLSDIVLFQAFFGHIFENYTVFGRFGTEFLGKN